MKSDIEIARSVKLKNIREIAAKVGFPEEEVFNYGKHIAKFRINLLTIRRLRRAILSLLQPLPQLRRVWVRLP